MQKSICNIILAQLHIVNSHAEIKQSSYFRCVLPCYLLSSLHFWHTRMKMKVETEAKDRESRSGMGAVGKEGGGGGGVRRWGVGEGGGGNNKYFGIVYFQSGSVCGLTGKQPLTNHKVYEQAKH